MNYLLEKEEIELKQGIKIKLIQTKKYKDLNIYFSFINNFSRKEYAALMVGKDIIGLISSKYNTKKEMVSKKNLLYAASVDSLNTFLSYNNCFTFHYNFVDSNYLDDVDDEDYVDFIKETLFNPLFNQDTINEAKKLLIDAINRKLDKPSVLAKNRVNQLLADQDKRFSVFDVEIVKDIEEITVDDLKNAYNKLFNESLVEIILIGDISNNLLDGIKSLDLMPRKPILFEYEPVRLKNEGLIKETKKIDQTSLIDVYKLNTNNTIKDKEYYTWLLSAAILGLLPSSLLFLEVREKLSLCYTISVSDIKADGVFMVHTLISKENINEVLKQIGIQIERLVQMDYSDDQFNTCKVLLIDSYIQGMDDTDSVFNFYHSRDFYTNESFDDFVKGIESVTKQDISDLLKDNKHIFSYVLTNEDGKDI